MPVTKYHPPPSGGAYVVDDPLPLIRVVNASTDAQVFTAATRTYVVGSHLRVPLTQTLGARTTCRWRFSMTKTAAGTATSTIDVAVGTAAGVADTARLSFTKPAGTAVADEGLCEVIATVRVGGASGVLVGQFTLVHNLAATGHATIPVVVVNDVSAGFDMGVEDLVLGLALTTGAADVVTVEMVQAELAFPGALPV